MNTKAESGKHATLLLWYADSRKIKKIPVIN